MCRDDLPSAPTSLRGRLVKKFPWQPLIHLLLVTPLFSEDTKRGSRSLVVSKSSKLGIGIQYQPKDVGPSFVPLKPKLRILLPSLSSALPTRLGVPGPWPGLWGTAGQHPQPSSAARWTSRNTKNHKRDSAIQPCSLPG